MKLASIFHSECSLCSRFTANIAIRVGNLLVPDTEMILRTLLH